MNEQMDEEVSDSGSELQASDRPGNRAVKAPGAPAEGAVHAACVAGERNDVVPFTRPPWPGNGMCRPGNGAIP